MRTPRRNAHLLAGAVLATLLAGACVRPGPPGVRVEALTADIVFGLAEDEEVAAPVAAQQAPAQAQAEDLSDDFLEIPEPRRNLNAPPAPPPPVECPPAGLTTVPKEPASVTIQGTPREGVYRFNRTVAISAADNETQTFTGYTRHAVRRVAPTEGSDHEFRFQRVSPHPLRGGVLVIESFLVNTNPEVVEKVRQESTTVGVVDVPGAEMVVTPPDDAPGYYLEKVEYQAADGSEAARPFEPVRPVLYLPIEEGVLKQGQEWESVGIDRTSGQVLRHEGVVLRKTRVDACGDLVEGFLIEANVSYAGETVYEQRYFYNIATQLGGLFIAENTAREMSGVTATVDTSLADPEPTELPESLR